MAKSKGKKKGLREQIVERPEVGTERTAGQVSRAVSDVFGLQTQSEGYGRPPAGTFRTYREMRGHPTVAMARAVATAPAKVANWSYEETDHAPKGAKDRIGTHLDGHLPQLLHHLMYALDYGFQAFEKVLDVTADEAGEFLGYRKLKPLIPDDVTLLMDRDTGAFGGIKQGKAELPVNKCFVFTYDQEGTDMYGRSRHENYRKTVWPAISSLIKQEGSYVRKAAGVTPIIQYPGGGTEIDATGKEVSAFEVAKAALAHLAKGNGFVFPNTMTKWAEELANRGVSNPEALKAWTISFLEAKVAHGAEFVSMAGRYDQLIFRGWLVPERAAMEGTHGTKAEAETHADVALMVTELLLADIARYLNWYVINPLLVWNYGQEAENTVTIVPQDLVDEQKSLLKEVMRTVLSNNVDVLMDTVDMDAAFDLLGLPKRGEAQALLTGRGSESDVSGLFDKMASRGNEVTLDEARQLAASARYIINGGNGNRQR